MTPERIHIRLTELTPFIDLTDFRGATDQEWRKLTRHAFATMRREEAKRIAWVIVSGLAMWAVVGAVAFMILRAAFAEVW